MKNKLALALLVLIAVALLSSLSSVFAADYYPVLTTSNQDGSWIQFDTMKMFSGKLVDESSVQVTYYVKIDDQPVTGPYSLPYARISLADSQVKIFFDIASLPLNVDHLAVSGTLDDGQTFYATGPGWTYIHH
jgi:hypothetical protein